MLSMGPSFIRLTVQAIVCGAVFLPTIVSAQTYASSERQSIAIGHYARARALLVEALAEFEQGRRTARPDMLLDSEEWRLSIISRTEELNRLLDPQPRVTRSGVQFKANRRLIRRERQRVPTVLDGAQDSNIYGEQQRAAELRQKRSAKAIAPSLPAARAATASTARKELATEEEELQLIEEPSTPVMEEEDVTLVPEPLEFDYEKTATAPIRPPGAKKLALEVEDEDADITRAIEEAIQSRLKKLQAEEDKEETVAEDTGF